MKVNTIVSTLTLTAPALAAITPRAVWQPAVGASWQIVLTGKLNIGANTQSIAPNVDIFDIDLFYNTKNGADKTIIDALHRLGKKVICYFSAGSYEKDRPDSNKFQAADKGNKLADWPEENWLNLNSANVRSIMTDRIRLAAQMGCDGIDPDNVDGYDENGGNNPNFKLTSTDSVNFMKFLANEAKNNNLAIGLKNAAEIIPSVLSVMQYSVNEECVAVEECSTFLDFIDAGKPVFHIEYPNSNDENPDSQVPVQDTTGWCRKESEDGEEYDISKLSTVIKNYDLDGWVQLCDKSTVITPTTSAS